MGVGVARMTVPVAVRWTDMDAYRHVNNVAIVQLIEESMIGLFWRAAGHQPDEAPTALSLEEAKRTASFVVYQEVSYISQLAYPSAPIPIDVWVGKIGSTSLDLYYEIPNLNGGIAAHGHNTVVMVDLDDGRPRKITDTEREVWTRYMDEPIEIRRAK